MKKLLGLAILTMSAATASMAAAYQMSPLKNKYDDRGRPGGFWENISEPVHEEITYAAARCAQLRIEVPSGTPAPCDVPEDVMPLTSRGNKYDPLIRGVWWNDDPNQLLFSIHPVTWVAWMRDASLIAKTGENWRGNPAEITSKYKMQYRSHYGDLQFLHAMANEDGEAPTVIQKRIVDWIEFAYGVATGRLDPATRLENVSSAIVENHFAAQPGWSIHYLFAPKYTLGAESIDEVALGSILHVLQDSFSDAHAERTSQATGRCSAGAIAQFRAYGSQDPDKHSVADTRSSWRSQLGEEAAIDAVEASAQMIQFAAEEADWDTTVKPYLLEHLFCIADDAHPSGPGEY